MMIKGIIFVFFGAYPERSYEQLKCGLKMSNFWLNLWAPYCSITYKSKNLGCWKLKMSLLKHFDMIQLTYDQFYQNIQVWARYEHFKLKNYSYSAHYFRYLKWLKLHDTYENVLIQCHNNLFCFLQKNIGKYMGKNE